MAKKRQGFSRELETITTRAGFCHRPVHNQHAELPAQFQGRYFNCDSFLA
jgi:hypothetical protein